MKALSEQDRRNVALYDRIIGANYEDLPQATGTPPTVAIAGPPAGATIPAGGIPEIESAA